MRLRVIDIETTGGSAQEIIEIGAVDVNALGGVWTANLPRTKLFRPRGEITPHAMAIHHLTASDFSETDPFCSDPALHAFITASPQPDVLVAHNAAFERQHLGTTATSDLPWICTVKAAREAWPEAPGYSNQLLRYWRGLILDPALAMPPHRAGPDAWVTAHLLIDLLHSATVGDLKAWSLTQRPSDRVPLGRYKGQAWSKPPARYLQWLIDAPEMGDDVVARARAELQVRQA